MRNFVISQSLGKITYSINPLLFLPLSAVRAAGYASLLHQNIPNNFPLDGLDTYFNNNYISIDILLQSFIIKVRNIYMFISASLLDWKYSYWNLLITSI